MESKSALSSAQTIVQLAAYRIDLHGQRLDAVMQRMDEESIHGIWQLNFLDSLNYQIMNFPIGLVASIRACLQDDELLSEAREVHFLLDQSIDLRVSEITNNTQDSTKRLFDTTNKSPRRMSDISFSQSTDVDTQKNDLPPCSIDHRPTYEFLSIKSPKLETIQSSRDLPPKTARRRPTDTIVLSEAIRMELSDLVESQDVPPQLVSRQTTDNI
jgi:hypothetical protein